MTSVQPRCVSSSASAHPTIPAPMITTFFDIYLTLSVGLNAFRIMKQHLFVLNDKPMLMQKGQARQVPAPSCT